MKKVKDKGQFLNNIHHWCGLYTWTVMALVWNGFDYRRTPPSRYDFLRTDEFETTVWLVWEKLLSQTFWACLTVHLCNSWGTETFRRQCHLPTAYQQLQPNENLKNVKKPYLIIKLFGLGNVLSHVCSYSEAVIVSLQHTCSVWKKRCSLCLLVQPYWWVSFYVSCVNGDSTNKRTQQDPFYFHNLRWEFPSFCNVYTI